MKRYFITAVVTALFFLGSSSWALNKDISRSVGSFYKIIPTTVGDDSLVDAIKKYSNITKDDVNKNKISANAWSSFRSWFIGAPVSIGDVEKIKNYIRVCMNLKLANHAFVDKESLRSSFPVNWTTRAMCLALKNLKDQGMVALALLSQMSGDGTESFADAISLYLNNIEHNRNLLKEVCTQLEQKRRDKQERAMKEAIARLTFDEKKWKNVSLYAKTVLDIDKLVAILRKGVADSLPTALLSAAALYFVHTIADK